MEEIQRVAERAALQAGRHFRDKAGTTDVKAQKDGSQDLVTEVDKECQNIVEESIQQAFPQHAILGYVRPFVNEEWLHYVYVRMPIAERRV